MDVAATVGLRLGSAVVAPLVRRLFRAEQPGAGLVDGPVRIDSLLSFRGERPTLTRRGLEKLSGRLVNRAVAAMGPHDAPPVEDRLPVTMALVDTLSGLGDLTMDDVQAVQLGADGLAEALRHGRPAPLSRDAELFHDRLVRLAALHIIDYFTRRSTFVARTLVEQSRANARVVETLNLLVERLPAPHSEDARFEETYRRHLVRRHGTLTILGIDVDDEWPLDDAYLSLETTETERRKGGGPEHGRRPVATPPQRAEQALAGLNRVLLRGVAGAGKTTLVQWLAVTIAEHRADAGPPHLVGRIPFVLPLRTLLRAGRELPPPRDFLAAVNCPHTPPAGWAERVLTAGRALLLVDGIDEVPQDRREQTRWWLREMLRDFPGNACLVTARPSAVREDWLAADDFRELSLSPMSHADVAAFVTRWHHAARAGRNEATALLTAVRSRQDLSRLATNPLMCGLICALHRASHGFLPQGREELYEAALRMLLERRDLQRSVDQGLRMDARSQRVLLERLAYWLIRNGHSQMEREDAVELIEQALPTMRQDAVRGSAEEVYRQLLDRSGLLREPAEGVVDFVHRTFQDYLAAHAAVENRDFPLLVRNAHLDLWEDVVRMAVAHGRPDERRRLLGQLLRRGDTVRKHRVRLHLLAMACLEHATQLDPEVRAEVERRGAALLPPRTFGEATSLASAGQVVLELLPGPEGLPSEEAHAVVETARLVGGDAALAKLAPFRTHPSPTVRERLLRARKSFDPHRFVVEIMPGLSLEGAPHITVYELAELSTHRRLAEHPYLSLFGAFSREEIVKVLAGAPVRQLSLSCERLGDLTVLDAFPRLERLSLIDGPALTDISAVAGLPLRRLLVRKLPRVSDLTCLNALPELRSLYVGDEMPGTSLSSLPTLAPLTDLGVPPGVTDLTGIGVWEELTTLRVVEGKNDFGPASLAAVAALPALNHLATTPPLMTALRVHGPALPRITRLDLFGLGGEVDLRQVVDLFPGLRTLQLAGEDAMVDLAPLAELNDLRALTVWESITTRNDDRLRERTGFAPLTSRY
ncbi:NACHT domain-containing NTPase [Streptomyces sp. NBRC 109706]|uniref:NACHT domain-containing protein n=1 Tax=Streptomyces sp. NBRC 109706 TaxID=1550035 RepID=UPI0007812A60|nr:NACHT domain-containing protein [Streptomyces sp. NBRC 109706]